MKASHSVPLLLVLFLGSASASARRSVAVTTAEFEEFAGQLDTDDEVELEEYDDEEFEEFTGQLETGDKVEFEEYDDDEFEEFAGQLETDDEVDFEEYDEDEFEEYDGQLETGDDDEFEEYEGQLDRVEEEEFDEYDQLGEEFEEYDGQLGDDEFKETDDNAESEEYEGQFSDDAFSAVQQEDEPNFIDPLSVKDITKDDPRYTDWAIPGQYIVVFEDSVLDATKKASSLIENYSKTGDAAMLWHYKAPFVGVALSGVDDIMLEFLHIDPQIKYVEQDVRVALDAVVPKYHQVHPPNWGLDRVDELLLVPTDGSALDGVYDFDHTGAGVTVFLLDTGIRSSHRDFVGYDGMSRINCAFDAYHLHSDHRNEEERGCFDGVGHGTHLAGIIGGELYGVAKDADIMSIKVFTDEGAGSAASVMAGMDYIQRGKLINPDLPTVANLSFGTPIKLQTLRESVAGLVNSGITVTTSSGNDAAYACQKSPAYMEEVITAAASTFEDTLAPFTNIGKCADIFAPGDRIASDWRNSDFDEATISGTSAAAAHVAGVAALILEKYPQMVPEEVKEMIHSFAEHHAVRGIPEGTDTRNLLLNMGELSLQN